MRLKEFGISKMNILIFNAHNPFEASGIVGLDLFNELGKRGSVIKLVVNKYSANYPEGIVSMETWYGYWKKRVIIKLRKELRLGRKIITDYKYHFNVSEANKEFYSTRKLLKKSKVKPDVIIILHTNGFINEKNIYELYEITHAPVYWLMYDMAPFTGGCHYAWECEGYQNVCGNCPALFSLDPFDISHKNLIYKKEFLDKTNIQIIAGSEWQYRQAKQSTLFRNFKINKILTSCNSSIFKPVAKEIGREKFGIPHNSKVIFFGATGLNEERKGIKYLLKALKELKEVFVRKSEFRYDIHLLVAGSQFDRIKDYLPFTYHYLGILDNTYGIASAYQTADLYVCPSVEDSGPTMINQCIMCGTPVVSFEMGVAIDLVINYKTGYRVKLKDSKALTQAMYDVLTMSDSDYLVMKDNCRNLAKKLYQPDVNYLSWENLLKENI